jgi:hypothetical protein
MKNAALWDVAPCGFTINRLFERTCIPHLQVRILARVISSTINMGVSCSPETSVYNKPTLRHIPEGSVSAGQEASCVQKPKFCRLVIASRVDMKGSRSAGHLNRDLGQCLGSGNVCVKGADLQSL